MENLFVPYELALNIKELGFNEGCLGRYRRQRFQSNTLCRLIDYNTTPVVPGDISAPLYQQAFDFFRVKYGIHSSIEYLTREKETPYGYFIDYELKGEHIIDDGCDFKKYEEARLACLTKLIQIVNDHKL